MQGDQLSGWPDQFSELFERRFQPVLASQRQLAVRRSGVARVDEKGIVLLLGQQEAWTPLTWACLEGVVTFLAGRGWVKIGIAVRNQGRSRHARRVPEVVYQDGYRRLGGGGTGEGEPCRDRPWSPDTNSPRRAAG